MVRPLLIIGYQVLILACLLNLRILTQFPVKPGDGSTGIIFPKESINVITRKQFCLKENKAYCSCQRVKLKFLKKNFGKNKLETKVV